MFDIPQPKQSKKEQIKQIGKKFYEVSKKRRDGRKVHKTVQYILYAVTLFFLITAISFAAYPPYSQYIYGQLQQGRENIVNVMAGVMDENFNKAHAWADLTRHNFSTAFEKFKSLKDNFFVSHITPLNNQFTDVERVLKSADTLSSAVYKATAIGKEMEDAVDEGNMISFSKFTLDEKRRILKVVDEREKEFEDIKADMDLAAYNLEEVKYYAAIEPFKDLVDGLKLRVTKERDTFAKALPMLKIMPGFFGYPEGVKYIAVIYDVSEPRAITAGAIDEFYTFELLYGEIMGCSANKVNEKGMPAQAGGEYEPLKQWFREDGNFDMDWNELARNINRYYPNHTGFISEFDGIISGSPDFVRDFFELSGPIVINGTEYNKDNIFKKINSTEWGTQLQAKQEDKCPLLKELKIRIFDLPPQRWADFIDVVHENTETKNINSSLKNIKVQTLIREQQAERE